MQFLVPLVLLFGLLQHAACACPSGWMNYGSRCYHFSHDKEPWANAEKICEMMGGHLLEIEDMTENNYMTSQLSGMSSKYKPFIALTDLAVEDDFVWMISNRKLTDASFTNWDAGQPDGNEGENCVYLDHDGEWHDTECENSHYYICERPDGSGINVLG